MSSTSDATQRFNGSVKKSTTELIDFVVNNYSKIESFQVVPADLTLSPAAGKSGVGAHAYLAAIMGNLLGNSLTKTDNTLAGVIGKYSVTGVRASTWPVGALIGEIADTITDADGAVIALVDGDSGITKAEAAFKAMSNNSTPGSGFNYGLDLHGPAHDGFADLAILKADVRMSKEVVILNLAGVPVDGVAGTGAGFAEIGSLAINRTAGNIYINAGTKASPTWKLVTRAA